MSVKKVVISGTIVLFSAILLASFFKKTKKEDQAFNAKQDKVQEICIEEEPVKEEPKKIELQKIEVVESKVDENLPDANLIDRLFATDSSRLPIVETVTYTSRVPWISGRPAWIADYASYYSTTRHFIARSLNRKPDYFSQRVAPGDRFNVLAKDKNLNFYLLIDLSRSKLWFYSLDLDTQERILLKTYNVGLGRKESKRKSGFLTPIGKYQLGSKVAIYKPGTMGYFQDQKVEMIKVFGTRWIPFEKEIESCSESYKGLGIHGAPWTESNGTLTEDTSKIGQYDSDGCIRLASDDIEELFAIIISKPTTIELVNDFHEAQLPGKESNIK